MNRSLLIIALSGSLVGTTLAGVKEDVDRLIPLLAAAEVSERHAPQMELQALAADVSRPGAEPQRSELAQVLAAKAADPAVPQPARVWIVRQLEHIGAAEAVPALSGLLRSPDQDLRDCARRALEKNSAARASDALRKALQEGRGGDVPFTIGLIHSLGERKDASSSDLIAGYLTRPEFASAAANALGNIASQDAVQALWKFYDEKQALAGDALLIAARQLTERGESRNAAAICGRLYDQCKTGIIRPAALVGLAAADPKTAESKIAEALMGTHRDLHVAAITAGRQVYGSKAAARWAAMLPKLPASAKLLVLRELDSTTEKIVLGLVADPDPELRLAALETLGRIGGGPSVSALLKCAAETEQPAKAIATESLARVSGPGADETLLKLSGGPDEAVRPAAITALGLRGYRPAVARLLAYAGDSNTAVSSAACAALGRMGTDAEIDALTKLALNKVPAAEDALQTVLARCEDKSGASKKLLALAKSAKPDQLPLLFSALAILGTDDSLRTLAGYAAGDPPDAQDPAIRALAAWPAFAAVPELLKLASMPDLKRVHNVLAIQGAARLIRVSDSAPAAARVDAALQAIKAAQRDEEKNLAVSALGSIPDRKAAEALKQLLSDASLKEPSAQAAITLANSLRRNDRRTAEELVQAIKAAGVSPALSAKADEALKR